MSFLRLLLPRSLDAIRYKRQMMELRHLRYFIAVAEELNFTRAAERVHIDQTPLSRAVRDLEDELNVQLFVRTSRRLLLTPAGARLLEEARKILIRIERTKRVVRQTHALHQASVRIGVADGIAQPKLASCLNSWQSKFPAIPLDLSDMRSRELVTALGREDIDVGFSFGVPESDSIAQEIAWTYPCMALLPLGHELGRSSCVELSDLASFPLIGCDAKHIPGLRKQVDVLFAAAGCSPTIVNEIGSYQGCVTMVAARHGVAIASAGHVETMRRDDVLAVPIAGSPVIHTYVLHKRRRFGSPSSIECFLAHAKSCN